MPVSRIIVIVLAGLLSLLGALAVTVPAGLVWKYAGPDVQRQLAGQVQVRGVTGRLFDGQALIQAQGIPALLAWNLSVSNLVKGESPLQLVAQLNQGRLEAQADISRPDHPAVTVRGEIDLGILNRMLARHRLKLSGELLIRDLWVSVDRLTGRPSGARGEIRWAGGIVQYPAGRQVQTADIPPLKGTLNREGTDIRLDITDMQGLPVLNIRLDGVGMAHVGVRKRLVDLAGAPWPGNEPPDTEIFKLRQRVL